MNTQNIHHKNINSYCRTCLADVIKYSVAKGQKFNVYQSRELSQWIYILTSLEVNKSDAYPKFLCKQCYEKLSNFNDFRSLCLKSKWTLDDILGRLDAETKNEVSTATKINNVDSKHDIVCKDEKEEQDEQLICESEFVAEEKYEEGHEITDDDADDKALINTENVEIGMRALSDCVEDASRSISDIETEEDDKDHSFVADSESEEIEHDNTTKKISKKRNKRCKDENFDAPNKMPRKSETKFKCPHCTRWCMSQENLDAHMRIHQGLKAFQCNQCHRGYTKSSRLKAHIRDMHQEVDAEITCSIEGCGKIFRRNGTYRAHYRKFHTEAPPPMTTYMCEQCGRTFKSITALREHRFKHASEEEYPYHCEQCGKRYTSQRTFKEHQMRHAGIKNFECPFCGMKKTTRNELRTHINYHTKEKQWHCPDCPSVFNSSANLGLHVRVVHKGIRRYGCRYCEQSFGKAETLKHHEMRHTGEKPHACDICGKRFIQVVALRTHLKTHNKTGEKLTTKQQKVKQESASQQQLPMIQQQTLPSTEEVNSACLSLVEDLSVA